MHLQLMFLLSVAGCMATSASQNDRTTRPMPETLAQPGHVIDIAVDPTGRWLAAVSVGDGLTVWDLSSAEQVDLPLPSARSVSAVAFSPVSPCLVCATRDLQVSKRCPPAWTESVEFRMPYPVPKYVDQPVFALAHSPDGRLVIVGILLGGGVFVWVAATGECVLNFVAHTPSAEQRSRESEISQLRTGVGAVTVDPELDWFLTGGVRDPERNLRAWDLRTGLEIREFFALGSGEGPVLGVDELVAAPDRRVYAMYGGEVYVWETTDTTAHLSEIIRYARGSVSSFAIDPRGQFAAIGHDDGTIALRDLGEGVQIAEFEAHGGGVWALAWVDDGHWFVSGSDDGVLRLWSTRDIREHRHRSPR